VSVALATFFTNLQPTSRANMKPIHSATLSTLSRQKVLEALLLLFRVSFGLAFATKSGKLAHNVETPDAALSRKLQAARQFQIAPRLFNRADIIYDSDRENAESKRLNQNQNQKDGDCQREALCLFQTL